MNELEKCMAGEWYDCYNEILLEYKNRARKLLMEYNGKDTGGYPLGQRGK